MDAKRLAEALKSLDAQSFRPGDSLVASTINHPIDAVGHGLDWLTNRVNTAAGIPDQYDNPNPLLAPQGQEQAAFDVAGMAQLGSMPFAPKSAGGTLGSITAWHGSPHKFDAFDMSKIGTGEGAQAYGHGLYFAENPQIAEGYKKALSGGQYIDKRGMPVQPNEIAADIYEAARKGGADVEEASDASSFWSLYLRDGDAMSNSPGFKYIKDVIDGRGIKFKHSGNLYKTSLEWPDPAREAADPLGPQHFLDWDKPLSEQGNSIKSTLAQIAKQKQQEAASFGDIAPDINGSGADIWGELGNYLSGGRRTVDSPELARKYLQEQGIPGIRYLDGGSRGAGEGSYNYVVFDDKIPKIVERNGNPLTYLLPATMLGYGMANQDKNPLAEALRNGN
jgi:hypothetical protein